MGNVKLEIGLGMFMELWQQHLPETNLSSRGVTPFLSLGLAPVVIPLLQNPVGPTSASGTLMQKDLHVACLKQSSDFAWGRCKNVGSSELLDPLVLKMLPLEDSCFLCPAQSTAALSCIQRCSISQSLLVQPSSSSRACPDLAQRC